MGLADDILPIKKTPLNRNAVSTALWEKVPSLSYVLSLRPDRK